jgi:hypothetical protein
MKRRMEENEKDVRKVGKRYVFNGMEKKGRE